MVVAGSKIRTTGEMVKQFPAEPLEQLCAQRRMRASVVVEQSPRVYHLFQHLKVLLTQKYFPIDDDLQTDGCHRLVPLSGGGSLRHRCIEISLTV
ncbi:hypothetical protein AVEN_26339-1 [Araneus ventricosus]|uniref:Uncharacterized protein n=1 Tax=Araneus ventricosus TaxID=182803 RepID=A0A4Y2APK0_ARAVE|nr:hypothetical protein AVEN_26339-1 [Araneus ventricosus]